MNTASLGETSTMRRVYHPLIELGRGGMSRVYLAECLASGIRKLVVLKALKPELCESPEMRAAFWREAELLAQMNHPNVVQVLDVVDGAQAPIMVMEYLDGTSFSVLRRRVGDQLSLPLHLHVLSQVLAGLHHFHELRDLDGAQLNAVHRDVSPQNVMVLHDGHVKVLDFGIAKITASNDQGTRAGVVKGKVHYMAPEQLCCEPGIDRRADVFSVGVMLWEAVANRRMWEGTSETEMLRSIVAGALPPVRRFIPRLADGSPAVPDSVVQIVERATNRDRENRFATAQEMQTAIEQVLAEHHWSVRNRDLADFMLRHLGESRRQLELRINSARRIPVGSAMVRDSVPAEPPQNRPVRGRDWDSPPPGTLETVPSRPIWSHRRQWGLALGALCCFTLVAALTHGRGKKSLGEMKQPTPRAVALEVEAVPPGSEIFLDDKLLGTDRFLGVQPLADHNVVLEVRAPGYLTERKEIRLDSDLAVKVVLEPDPAVARQEASALAPSSSGHSYGAPPSPRSQVRVPRASQGFGGVSRGSSANKCDPPYTFSADGVKTYKPECF